MVAEEMVNRAFVTLEGSIPNVLQYPGSQRGIMTLSRLEQGKFAASQIFFSGFKMSFLW